MIAPIFKYAMIGVTSLAGVSGITLKDTFLPHVVEQICIASDRLNSAGTKYINSCDYSVNAMICEEYGDYNVPLFGQARGMKTCFNRTFAPLESFGSMKISDQAPTNISVTECSSKKTPQWNGAGFSCFL